MKKDKIIEYLLSEGEIFDHLIDGDLHKLTANQYILLDDDSNTFKLIQLILGKKEKSILDSKGKEITQKEEIIEGYKTIKSFDISNVSNVAIDKYAMSRVYTFDNGEKIRVNSDYASFENYLSKHHISSNFQERKWYRKIICFRSATPWKMILTTLITLGLIFLVFDALTENETEKNDRIAQELKDKQEGERLVKQAKEQENKKKEEKKQKIKNEVKEKKQHEKDYKNDFASVTENQMHLIDKYWNENWINTFDGISDGSINNFDAYGKMADLETKYQNLIKSYDNMPTPDYFTDTDRESFETYKREIQSMLGNRIKGIERAKILFNENNVKPEDLEYIKQIIKEADKHMVSGIAALTSLNMQYNHEYKK